MIASRRSWGDEQGGHPVRGQETEQQAAQPGGRRFVEGDEGFVEEQQARPHHEGAGDRHPPDHAERQARGVDMVRIGQSHLGQHLADAAGDLRLLAAQHEAQIVLDRAPGQQAGLLENVADAGPLRHLDAALETAIETGHDVEQRGLAAAGGTGEDHRFARSQGEVQAAENLSRARRTQSREALFDDGDGQRRHCVSRRSSGWRRPHSMACTTRMKARA